jgi:hypothetical protein
MTVRKIVRRVVGVTLEGRAARAPARTAQVRVKPAGKTVDEFCAAWDISRGTYDKWKKLGRGPVELQPGGPGGRVIITPASEAEWQRRHTGLDVAAESAEDAAATDISVIT